MIDVEAIVFFQPLKLSTFSAVMLLDSMCCWSRPFGRKVALKVNFNDIVKADALRLLLTTQRFLSLCLLLSYFMLSKMVSIQRDDDQSQFFALMNPEVFIALCCNLI